MIFVDDRERDLIREFKRQNIPHTVKRLLIGDMVCGNICTERKTISDFVSSIIDGRIFEQLQNMANNYKKIVLIIEGYFNELGFTKFGKNSYLGLLASLTTRINICILQTDNTKETAYLINKIVEKSSDGKTFEYEIFKIKKNKDKRVCVLMLIDGINEQKAKKIITKYPSLKNLLNATQEELIKIEGIGHKTARNIVDFFGLFKN